MGDDVRVRMITVWREDGAARTDGVRIMGVNRSARRPGYEDYKRFPARYQNQCSLCGKYLAVGYDVIGKPLGQGRWDIVCIACGTDASASLARTPVPSQAPWPSAPDLPLRPTRTAHPAPRLVSPRQSAWSTLVEYLLSCVVKESLVAPVPLSERNRWAVLPATAETVLCGNDLTVPLLPQVQPLFADLERLEGVFYGWPTVVVLDERDRPFVAPLFLRQLNAPTLDEASAVTVAEPLPQVNVGLLSMKWFPPESLASAATTLAGQAVGFGLAEAVVSTANRLLTALGVPLSTLDPTNLLNLVDLGEPWRPQEVGVFNMVMAFRGQLDAATRSLTDDLRWMTTMTDWDRSAARLLFEDAPPPPVSLAESGAVMLNDAQEQALACAATAPLTVIAGPPGTGKSQVVTAVVADAWRRGESVLLSSTNNRPIDDVIDHKARSVDPALVLRTGNAEKRQELGDRLHQLADTTTTRTVDPAAASLSLATLQRHQLAYTLGQHAEVNQAVLGTSIRRDQARAVVWPDGRRPPDALRPAIRSQAEKATRTRWRWLRRRRTARLLAMAGITDLAMPARAVLDWVTAEDDFDHVWRQLTQFHQRHPRDLLAMFDNANQQWQTSSAAAVRNQITNGLTAGRDTLIKLAESLTESTKRREAIEQAMVHVKGWATTALSTRPNLTCRAGVIDLVVIDEASQCTLAHVLPLAYRAKRLVIVGDPKQLPPVVTAHPEELRALAIAAGTTHEALAAAHHTYGEDSAYTAFAARFRPEPLLLDEHYRCHPEIIGFCNHQFYRDTLTVLTSVDRNAEQQRGLEWRDVNGYTEPGRSGSALNRAEADAVVDWVLASNLLAEQIGVVTPFRAQAAHISKLLKQRGHSDYADVQVGTAHTFQGGERHTIIFSTVISTGAFPGTVNWLETERNLINVAVSRAQQHLVVFGNRAALANAKATTLLSLADAAISGYQPAATHTPAMKALHAALVARGLPAVLGGIDEGYLLAITLAVRNGQHINVEIDDFPDGDPRGRRQRQNAVRDANVSKLGWRIVRVSAWQAYLNPTAVAEQVVQLATD